MAPQAHTQAAPAASEDSLDFQWSYSEEPHRSRREAILKKYGPQVKALYGHDPVMKWKVLAAVAAQVALAYWASGMAWGWMLLLAYTIGGSINHSMTLAMHELSHGLGFRNVGWGMLGNKLLGLAANLPLGIPSFVSFKRYHMEHHRYQGEAGIDVDVPTAAETRVFTTSPRKLAWIFMQPLFYALRPMFVVPKNPSAWEGINWAVQVAFDAGIYWAFGGKALVYLIIGTLLGMGFHPMAGHFVAEHYTFIRGQETYSYYGPLNWLSHNVGYHNEHHDFPFIAGARLPELRAIAPEFYDPLPCHNSWFAVIWEYIVNPGVGPHSRVMRASMSEEKRASILRASASE